MSDGEVDCGTCSTVAAAARQGHLSELRCLINEGNPVDVKDNRGWRPLHDAAFNNNTDCLQFLLELGTCDVNWGCFEGRSPLLLSAEQGHVESARLLLQHGANANLCDSMDTYPILAAVRSESADLVRLLLEHGARTDVHLYCGTTPLHQAAMKGHLDILEILLESGATLDVKEEYGITPVFSAAQHGMPDCLKRLLEKAKELGATDLVNHPAEDGATPLFLASQEGHTDCVRLLLEHGASADVATLDPDALPLHAALQFNHVECVKLLLPKTCRTRLPTCSASVFYFSTVHTDTRCTRLLIDAGIDVNARQRMEEGDEYEPKVLRYFQSNVKYSKRVCPLALVALYRRPLDSAKVLLASGALVNPRTPFQVPPLLPFLDNFRLELAELLIAHGASVNLYHPKVISNMALIVCLHYWNGLNLLLRCGAEAKSLFRCDVPAHSTSRFSTLTAEIEDAMSHDEFEDYENEVGLLRYPVPFWRNLAEAKYLMGRTGVQVYPLLLRLLCFVGSVRVDPRIKNYLEDDNQMKTLLEITESPRPLMHLCRLVVRSRFTAKQLLNDACIKTLPLPDPVLDYLLYTELD